MSEIHQRKKGSSTNNTSNDKNNTSTNTNTNNEKNDDNEMVEINIKVTSLKRIFSADLRSLALFRIFVSMFVIYDTYRKYQQRDILFIDNGLWSREQGLYDGESSMHVSFERDYNPYYMVGSINAITFLMRLHMFFAFCMMIGLFTPFMALLTWYMQRSLYLRNTHICDKGDHFILLPLFWCIFVPMNYHWSIDRLRKSLNFNHSSFIYSKDDNTRLATGMGVAGLICQPLILYFMSVVEKWGFRGWMELTMVYYSLCSPRDILKSAEYFRTILYHLPILTKFLTLFTLILEALGPILLIFPIAFTQWRFAMWLLFCVLQIGFASNLYLYVFPFASSISMFPIMPSRCWTLPPFSFIKTSEPPLPTLKQQNIYKNSEKSKIGYGTLILSFIFGLQIFGHIGMARSGDLYDYTPLKSFKTLEHLDSILHLSASWDMYTGNDEYASEWGFLVGVTQNGRIIDLRDEKELTNASVFDAFMQKHRYERFNMFIETLNEESVEIFSYPKLTFNSAIESFNEWQTINNLIVPNITTTTKRFSPGSRKLLSLSNLESSKNVKRTKKKVKPSYLDEDDDDALFSWEGEEEEDDDDDSYLEESNTKQESSQPNFLKAFENDGYNDEEESFPSIEFNAREMRSQIRKLFCKRRYFDNNELFVLWIGKVETFVPPLPKKLIEVDDMPELKHEGGVKMIIYCNPDHEKEMNTKVTS